MIALRVNTLILIIIFILFRGSMMNMDEIHFHGKKGNQVLLILFIKKSTMIIVG